VQFIGGLLTGSLALLGDAGHNFSDSVALLLAFFALRLATCEPTERHTYGLHRSEVFAALLNALALLGICGAILWEAYQRILVPPEVRVGGMTLFAALGLAGNLFTTFFLRAHVHRDLNMRGAYLHMLGDVLGSVAVLLAAGIMYFTHWYLADPLLSVGFALVILYSAFGVGREALHILMEGTPLGMSLQEVASALTQVPSVVSVHHLHAWSICSNVLAVSVHVVGNYTSEREREELKEAVRQVLAEGFGFSQTTIETECGEVCPTNNGLVHPFRHEEG
jgi:cobalt-zinc-cadmium efflux system protein